MGSYDNYLYHHGIKGQKWGVRRTPEQLGYKLKSKIDDELNFNSRSWAYNKLTQKNANTVVVDGNKAAYALNKDGNLAQIDENGMRSISKMDYNLFVKRVDSKNIKRAQKIIDKNANVKLTDLNDLRAYSKWRNMNLDFSSFENRLK